MDIWLLAINLIQACGIPHSHLRRPAGSICLIEFTQRNKSTFGNGFKAKALKIYGEADGKMEARQMIKEEVDRPSQLERTIVLDQSSVGFFMRQGLAQLKGLQVAGEESRTKLVFVTQCKGKDQHPCPICTDEISHPEQLGC
jgi:hypothetical protein